jgi:gliding motility-associated-like protein
VRYLWNDGQTTQTASNLCPGSYSVTVTVGCLLKFKDSVVIKLDTNVPKVLISPGSDSICRGSGKTLNASGANTYSWSPSIGLSCFSCPNPTASPTTTTTYTVIGFDTSGCSDTINITVKVLPLPQPVITGSLKVCSGQGDTLRISGGTSYLWSNGSTLNQYVLSNITGDSTVSVEVFKGDCYKDTTIKVSIVGPPSVNLLPGQVCTGGCTTLTAIAGGTGNIFFWSNGATTDTTLVCPPRDSAISHYSVTVSNGCGVSIKTTYIQAYTPLLFACCDKTIKQGGADTIAADSALRYKWSPINGLNCDTCNTVIASPSVTTTYTVTGTDSSGCITIREITVTVEIGCNNFIVPNIFTPGVDGINAQFFITTENLDKYSITIYDRWGKEMYKSSNQYQAWNGNTEEGAQAPDGVYYYTINSTCQGNTYNKHGFVQLIR